jgi:hypothetical protein
LRYLLLLLGLLGVAQAQMPDVRFRLDLNLSAEGIQGGPGSLQLYDPMGHTSNASIAVILETGIRAYASQRLEQISHDPSHDPLEEYYVEDPGIWKLGKQYLPFGTGAILRENVIGARGDFSVLENVNLAIAYCDGGAGDQEGFIGRLGNRWGISAAIGRHFGISPTSLDVIRLPDQTPGSGAGWKQVVGADNYQKFGKLTAVGEVAIFTGGEERVIKDLSLFDVSATYAADKNHSAIAGWSRDLSTNRDYYRLSGSVNVMKQVAIVPLIRVQDSRFLDFSLTIHVRV